MVEFQYDEKTYRRMSVRIGLAAYAVIFGALIVACGAIMAVVISNWLKEDVGSLTYVIGALFFALVLGALLAVMVISIRKQLSNSFAMYSANGVLLQRAEISDEELVITNVSRQNVTKINRRDIMSVKKYKDFFVVITNTKVKWAAPLNEQTQLLYDVLTGKSSVADLPAKTNVTEEGVAVEKIAEQPTVSEQSDALSFEYELSEPQAIDMLTKVITSRLRMALIGIIISSLFTLGFLTAVLVAYFTENAIFTTGVIFVVVFALITALFAFTYGARNKSGRVSGANYFKQQSKDGRCILRIELYNQGIISVNVLRDTRAYFRITDMERVSLFNDFFFVEFKSKELLPVPLTEGTRRLYEILNEGVKQSQR